MSEDLFPWIASQINSNLTNERRGKVRKQLQTNPERVEKVLGDVVGSYLNLYAKTFAVPHPKIDLKVCAKMVMPLLRKALQ